MTHPIVFDIETEAFPHAEQLAMFEPEFTPDARLKDPAKIADDIKEKKMKWLEMAALYAERSRVLVVGTRDAREVVAIEGDETSILKTFWKAFESSNSLFVGHFIKGFDVPYMARRSYILGVKTPKFMEGRYLSSRFVDTMELWGAGEWGAKISLDNLARAFGVGKKNGDGKDFAALWHSNKPAAMEYLKNDLDLTFKVAQKMGIIS